MPESYPTRPSARRPFVVTPYVLVADGNLVPELPDRCPQAETRTGSRCRISAHHHRKRSHLDLSAPDHTTLSRRGQHLDVRLRRVPTGKAFHLIVDSTGLSIVGEGEWAAAKHGRKGKRGWKKLHLGVDGAGVIVAQVLTDGNADDSKTGIDLIHTVEDDVSSFTADAAYDTIAIYRGEPRIGPRSARVSGRGRAGHVGESGEGRVGAGEATGEGPRRGA